VALALTTDFGPAVEIAQMEFTKPSGEGSFEGSAGQDISEVFGGQYNLFLLQVVVSYTWFLDIA
jgi:hypothetical protein